MKKKAEGSLKGYCRRGDRSKKEMGISLSAKNVGKRGARKAALVKPGERNETPLVGQESGQRVFGKEGGKILGEEGNTSPEVHRHNCGKGLKGRFWVVVGGAMGRGGGGKEKGNHCPLREKALSLLGDRAEGVSQGNAGSGHSRVEQ